MNKIDCRSWMAMHPYVNMCDTDTYYLLIAGELLDIVNSYLSKLSDISVYEAEWIACCLTAYYEDRTSGINLFRSLNELHNNVYGKCIPFYPTDFRYDTEGVNQGDLNFVIWNCLQQIQIYKKEAIVISPYAKEIIQLGLKVYTKFKKVFKAEYSNINHQVRSYYYMFNVSSVDEALDRIHSLKTRTYLLSTYEEFLRFKENGDMVATRPCEEIISPLMLGLYPHQWYAQMLSFYRKEYSERINNIEIYPLDSYRYEYTDKDKQFFSSLNSERKIHLQLASLVNIEKLIPQGHYLHSSLIKFNNSWELVPPVQITRSSESRFRLINKETPDHSVYVIRNTNEKLNLLYDNQKVMVFHSFDSLLSSVNNGRIVEELKEYFNGAENSDFVLYAESNDQICVLRGVARFIVNEKNDLYDRDFAAENLPFFMAKTSIVMRKILVEMMLRNLIVDMCEIENNLEKKLDKDNFQFLSSYLVQHL